MRLVRGDGPQAIDFVSEHFVLHEFHNREEVANIFKDMIRQMKDDFFLMAAFSDAKKDEEGNDIEQELLGFILGYTTDRTSCFLPQIWVKSPADKLTTLTLLHRIYFWAEAKGCVRCFGETSRGLRDDKKWSPARRWGVRVLSVNTVIEINHELMLRITSRLTSEHEKLKRKEVTNGRHEHSTKGDEPDGQPRVSSEPNLEVPVREVGSGEPVES